MACYEPLSAADVGTGSSIRATITRYESRWRVQPPSQVTSQSPKREPNVTGVRSRRNLVSSGIVLTVTVNTSIALENNQVKLQLSESGGAHGSGTGESRQARHPADPAEAAVVRHMARRLPPDGVCGAL